MIRIRLKELLDEYGASISEVSMQTGINRASLTQLAENKSKMIKFNTLDKLKIFFHLEDIYELFIDDDSATIKCVPHQLSTNQSFLLDFFIDVQLTRDSEPIHKKVTVKISVNKVNEKNYLLTGFIERSPQKVNSLPIVDLFNKIHPMVINRFFDDLSSKLVSSPYVVDSSNDQKEGIFETSFCKQLFENKAYLHISIPELNLVNTLQFLGVFNEKAYKSGVQDFIQGHIVSSPMLSDVFSDYSVASSPISLSVLPVKK